MCPLLGPSSEAARTRAAPLWRASERQVRIEISRCSLGHELSAPGALDLGAVGEPEVIAYQLDALEDCEGLLGRPVRRQRERRG
jgi:hypothetical protein